MIYDEYEIKLLISRQQYDKLLKLFSNSNILTFEQSNYYYDTEAQDMRRQNTTVRIRRKNSSFIATVKEHQNTSMHSIERSFCVDGIPKTLTVDNQTFLYFGELYTKRKEINICDGITIMLDYNKYLGTEDYELELEYVPEFKEKADGIILTLQTILGYMETPELSKSKSERFFETLFETDGSCLV